MNGPPVVLEPEAFDELRRMVLQYRSELTSLRRSLQHAAVRRHQGLFVVPAIIHRGITDEAATKHSSTTYTVSRYNPGTTVDSGTNDEVIFELIDVGSGKVVHYFKSGDKFYMTSVECPNT